MTRYRFVIRHNHIETDLALATQHAAILRKDKDFKGSVKRKDTPASREMQQNGEVWIAHGTPEETATLTGYEESN